MDKLYIRLVIAGSRDFTNFNLLIEETDKFITEISKDLKSDTSIEVVSGTARGADSLGEDYAKLKGYSIKQFKPDWKKGKGAGFIRNEGMAQYSTHAIIFDLGTNGAGHMARMAEKYNLRFRVIRPR